MTFQSQMLHFWESQSTLFKNGQKKCPKSKTKNTFGSTFSLKYNKFPKQLKDPLLFEKDAKLKGINFIWINILGY
jgi:hypothetical protein